jgi:hypothetical protein
MWREWSALRKLIWLRALLAKAVAYIWAVVSGEAPLSLVNSLAKPLKSLTQYCKCVQIGTPTLDAPAPIMCNNGEVKYGWHDIITTSQLSGYGTYVSPAQAATTRAYRWLKDLPNGTYTFSVDGDYEIIVQWRDPADPTSSTAQGYENLTGWITSGVVTLDKTSGGYGIAVRRTSGTESITPSNFNGVLHVAEHGLYVGGGAVGKNLANVNADTALVGYYVSAQGVVTADANNWMYQAYIRVKPSTTYTLSISQSVYYVSISEYSKANDSGFIARKAGNAGSNTSLTITTEANTNFIRFGTNIDRAAITLEEVLGINWQVEEGATATAYEPYTETPYAPETLTVSGKNLNGGEIGNKGYTSTGSESTSTTFAGTLFKIPCKEGDKFTASWGGFTDGVSGVFVNTWKTDGTWNARQAISASSSLTYTIPAGVGTVNFTLYKTGGVTIGDDAWLQVEYGTTATDYEPYVDPQTAAVENLLSTGQFSDTQEIIAGLKNHRVRAVVFDGTEDWKQSSSNPYKVYLQVPRDGRQMFTNIKVFCSHFKPAETATWSGLQPGECLFEGMDGDYYSFDFYTDGVDRDTFKSRLAELYAAGTPLFMLVPNWDFWDHGQAPEQVTPQPLHTTEGMTIINVESNVGPVVLEAEYAQAQ